jgi:hypothetical protein
MVLYCVNQNTDFCHYVSPAKRPPELWQTTLPTYTMDRSKRISRYSEKLQTQTERRHSITQIYDLRCSNTSVTNISNHCNGCVKLQFTARRFYSHFILCSKMDQKNKQHRAIKTCFPFQRMNVQRHVYESKIHSMEWITWKWST